jgi:cytidylate kinase
METSRDVIAVDGLGASGKSALAKGLATFLGYGHLNSGLLYRAVALICSMEKVDCTDANRVVRVMSEHSLNLGMDEGRSSVVIIDGVVHSMDLFSAEMSRGASLVARHQGVRDRLLTLQREAFMPGGVVAEGRDMGTVIFPNARVKFFVVARLDVRAARRYQQLKGTAQETSVDEITRELAERDERDASSAVGTMKQADGAIVIDNSDEPLDVVIRKMAALVAR